MIPALELELIAGPALAHTRWRLTRTFAIGRAPASALQLPDAAISRHHAIIEHDAGGWSLSDCGSQIGTRLNELVLEAGSRAALRPGDVLTVGAWRFRATTIPASAPRPTPADADIRTVSGRGALAEQRLELLLRCAGDLAAAPDEQAMADLLAEYALLGSGYSRATVLWPSAAGPVVRSVRPVGGNGRTAAPRFNRALLASTADGDIAELDDALSAVAEHSAPRRALCAPLWLDGAAAAWLYLDSGRVSGRRHGEAPTFCHALTRVAAFALANLRRLASERERVRLDADLDHAHAVQQRLLPPADGAIGNLAYALHLHPGRRVAGDIVDVFALAEGRVAALVGDVSGAGFGAALVMASVQSFLRAELAHHDDAARAVRSLNAHLCAQLAAGCFVTLWLGIFDLGTRSCRFVDAGHSHALRLRPGVDATPLCTHGDIPLGIDAQASFQAETLHLAAGELLVLYSDGVTEQRAPDGALFGRQTLIGALTGATAPSEAVRRALAALQRHAGDAASDDDTTLLAVG